MRTPTGTAGAVAALMNSGQFCKADCYTFTLIDGTILRYTDCPVDVTVNGVTYSSSGVQISRNQLTQKVGVVVDTMELDIAAKPTDLIEGMPWYSAIRLGLLDGAVVDLDVAIGANFSTAFAGTFNWFSGSVSSISPVGRTGCTIDVTSDSERMAVLMPRRLFQSMCGNNLFDNSCRLNRASYQYPTTLIGPGDGTDSWYSTGITNSSLLGYFDQGYCVINGGTYNGMRKTIKGTTFAGGNLYFFFFEPWPAPLSNQAIYAYPGCDKQKTTCSSKFNNIVNFVGEPYIPVPETVV